MLQKRTQAWLRQTTRARRVADNSSETRHVKQKKYILASSRGAAPNRLCVHIATLLGSILCVNVQHSERKQKTDQHFAAK